ncbi:YndM family protein [Virgibacillus sp. NKC19-16]|uniref:YndM family protein n=1 Tax=Virgibacillus salidurans TaxID=2831673 RepID=UPI001F40B5E5|nr:YndM family protein [Virgibacillus sp. NKC19-16]UJL47224.1 YndM family protein [Virgibacillus sp. NKC19-16]
MRHVTALVIKFLITATVVYSLLSIFNVASILEMFLISLFVTGGAYIIGDLILLPRFGNGIASIADFGLATVGIWLLSLVFIGAEFPIFTLSLIAAFFIAVCEAVFHIYMQEKVLTSTDIEHDASNSSPNRMQTEFSEEKDVHDVENKNKKG